MYSIYKTNTTIWLYVYVHIRQHSQNSLNYTKSNVSDRIVKNSASRWSVWVSRHELPKHIPPKEPTPRGYVGSRNLDLNSQWPVTYVKTNGSCKSWDIFWSFFWGGIKVKIFQLDAEIEFQTWTICLPFFLQSSSWLVEHSCMILQTSCHSYGGFFSESCTCKVKVQWFVNPGRSFNSGSGEVATLRKKSKTSFLQREVDMIQPHFLRSVLCLQAQGQCFRRTLCTQLVCNI